jgi:hypothetical protein
LDVTVFKGVDGELDDWIEVALGEGNLKMQITF